MDSMQEENVIYRMIHKRKMPVFFAEHLKYLKINEFYAYTLSELWQIKLKQLEPGHYTF